MSEGDGGERLGRAFAELHAVMARLRRDCPWDRKQTHRSLRRYLIEECHEVLEALDEGDAGALREELGDLLFQVWFHAELASEGGESGFDLADVLEGITAKLRRRHPHVFGDVRADDAEAVKRNWERLKREEGRTSLLGGVPPELPALLASEVIQEKAASVGFDWSSAAPVADKVREELAELLAETPGAEAGDPGARERVAHELGDVLSALVNWGRHLGVSAEDSLREANRRFRRRFAHIEEHARTRGRDLGELTLDEMEALWQEAKRRE